jgi:predicted RNA-binding protein (TIGR00451 family)
MFKVESSLKSTKATRVLRKSDRRKLLEAIGDASLVAATLGDADVELRPLADCTLIAAVRGDAYFVDLNGDSKFMPTLLATLLATAPLALPVFETHAAVFVQHLSQGADFMLPGCLLADRMHTIEPAWSVGDVVVVAVGGAPVALGTALMSRADAATAGRKGKLVRVLHYYGDALWLASSRRGNDAVVAALTGANNRVDDDDDNDDNNDDSNVVVVVVPETPVSVDEILMQSFLRGCSAVQDDELPMLVSSVFRAHACQSTCWFDS